MHNFKETEEGSYIYEESKSGKSISITYEGGLTNVSIDSSK